LNDGAMLSLHEVWLQDHLKDTSMTGLQNIL